MTDDLSGPRYGGDAVPAAYDPELCARATQNLKRRKEFRQHVTAYLIVNAALVLVWLITSGWFGYFWPVWVMIGWGVGLAFHAVSLRDAPVTAQQIQEEALRIAQRDARRGPQDAP